MHGAYYKKKGFVPIGDEPSVRARGTHYLTRGNAPDNLKKNLGADGQVITHLR